MTFKGRIFKHLIINNLPSPLKKGKELKYVSVRLLASGLNQLVMDVARWLR